MKLKKALFTILFVVIGLAGLGLERSEAFSFSGSEESESLERDQTALQREKEIRSLLEVPCDEKLKKRKIALIIGEEVEERGIFYQPGKYGPLFQEISRRLKALGLRTYTQEEIQAQIAREEVKAFLNNNVDAAATAAQRLGAGAFLRGMIRTKVRVNPVVGIDEVFVTMAFTLVDSAGRVLSNVTAGGDSFSGADSMAVALKIVRSEADLAVARIYNDYCRNGTR